MNEARNTQINILDPSAWRESGTNFAWDSFKDDHCEWHTFLIPLCNARIAKVTWVTNASVENVPGQILLLYPPGTNAPTMTVGYYGDAAFSGVKLIRTIEKPVEVGIPSFEFTPFTILICAAIAFAAGVAAAKCLSKK